MKINIEVKKKDQGTFDVLVNGVLAFKGEDSDGLKFVLQGLMISWIEGRLPEGPVGPYENA